MREIDNINFPVLLIGSDLSAFSGLESPTLKRFNDYSKRCGMIIGLCYSPPGYSIKNIQNRIILYPTNSKWKPMFLLDGIRIGLNLIKKWKPEIIVAQDSFAFGLLGLILKRLTGIPLVIHYHSGFYTNEYWLKEKAYHRLLARLGVFVSKRADLIRTVSTDIKNDLIKSGLPHNKVFYASPPVSGQYFIEKDSEEEKRIINRHSLDRLKTFIFIGRLSKEKNISMIFKAIRILSEEEKDIRLLMIGDGPQREYLQNLANAMGIKDNIIFLGIKPNKELKNYIRSGIAVLITSFYEGTAKVIKEAAFSGRITISTATSGVKDAIRDGETGIIIPIGDIDRLVSAMRYVINNPEIAMEMGKRARDYVMRKFNPDDDVDRIVRLWMYARGLNNRA